MAKVMQDPELQMLNVMQDGVQDRIAVRHRTGSAPGLFWLGGFRSNMDGTKAAAIDDWARSRAVGCTRFDYSGHGLSSGAFADGTITRWLGQAKAVYEAFATVPQVLVGSSMGGWLSILLTKTLAEGSHAPPVKGLVLIAPAVNMTSELMWDSFDDETRRLIRSEGIYERASSYSTEPDVITRSLIDDGAHHCLDNRPLKLNVPVRILQGQNDQDIPWTHSVALTERLAYDDTVLTLVKEGDHRLSRDDDIALLLRTIGNLLGSLT